jgi:hypothetical protein
MRKSIAQNNPQKNIDGSADLEPVYTLSKTGKNVFVIMLDGAINSYFPLFLEERPDLKKYFDGFIYYPNTISSYRRTLFGTPPLFGGYEYTTYNMNKRTDRKMRDKHNEALLLMPEIFKQHDFDVTVTHLPYINYDMPLEDEFYSNRGIKAQDVNEVFYGNKYLHDVLGLDEYTEPIQGDKLLRRNILMFSILETTIYSLRDIIYQNGKYWSTTDYTVNAGGGGGIFRGTLGSYSVLYYLPEITGINKETKGTLSVITNNLTHDPAYLQYPDYTVEAEITKIGNNFFQNDSFKYYHVNAAAYILLAKWFAHLRSEDVWDNTRIIIVSDHGDGGITNPHFSSFQNNLVLPYSPILLYKDFAKNDPLETNNEFMTNADVPLLAVKDIVENPTNPFTGKPLKADKENGIYIFLEGYTNTTYYTGTTCLEDNSQFYRVHDSIFDSNNWQKLRYKDFKDKQ